MQLDPNTALSALNDMQSLIYKKRTFITRGTKQLGKRDILYLEFMQKNATNLPDSLISLFGHMIEYNKGDRAYKEIVAAAMDPSGELKTSFAKDMLPILIKECIGTGKVRKVTPYIKAVADEKQKIELIDAFGIEILRAGYFDEMLELYRSVPDMPTYDHQELCRQLVCAGECMIALKLIETISGEKKRESMLNGAIAAGFSRLSRKKVGPSDFREFLEVLFEKGYSDKCINIAIELVEVESQSNLSLKMIAKVLIERGEYKRALKLTCTHIGKTTFKELSAQLLKERDYEHAICVLGAIHDPKERKEALEELALKFHSFGMTKFGNDAEALIKEFR